MKKIILFISFVFCFVFSFGQSIVPRSNGSLTVTDSNWFGGNSFRVPIFPDTSTANTRRPSLDSAGKVIFTRNTNWFWGRQTSPARAWIPFNNSATQLNNSCGNPSGTHTVTWDSLLTFDVSGGPYVLCCDGIPRATNATTITLDSNGADEPRYDLIILDSNGVNFVKGTPAANPSTPQTDSCQIILTYVLIRAHDTVPAVITPTNPLVIYDENYYFNDSTEFVLDTSANFGSIDTADLSNPVHLLHDLKVTNPSSANAFKFQSVATFDLNDYGALKFYVRKAQAAATTLLITFYLDSVQQTLPVQVVLPNGGANTYATIIIPIANIRFINTSQFNQVKFQFGAPQTGTFYFDWIQLQMGFPIVNTSQAPVVTANNLNPIFNTTVTNGSNINFTQQNATAQTVLGNRATTAGPYSWVKVNLGTMIDSLLAVFNLFGGSNGDILKNVNNVWTPVADSTEIDTVFTDNWIAVGRASATPRDTLQWGSRYPDSSLLSFNTYLGLNGHFVDILENGQNWLLLDPTTRDSRLAAVSADNTKQTSFFARAGSNTYFDISSIHNADMAEIKGDAINKNITVTADSILLASTLSGTSTGYVWTLKDPSTGSGYWAAGGGAVSWDNTMSVSADLNDSYVTTISTDDVWAITGDADGALISVFNNRDPGNGFFSSAITGYPAWFSQGSAANGVFVGINIDRTGIGSPANGDGVDIIGNLNSTTGLISTNKIIFQMDDATGATMRNSIKLTGNTGGSNSDVDLAIFHGDGSWQIRPITATAASAITPAEGMIVFVSNTNGTFTSIGFWGYQNGAWHAF